MLYDGIKWRKADVIYDDWGNDFDAVILGDNFLFNIVSDMNYEQSQKLMIQKSADALAVGGHFFWIMDTRYIRKNGFIIPMRILYRKVPTVMGTSEEWLYWIALMIQRAELPGLSAGLT